MTNPGTAIAYNVAGNDTFTFPGTRVPGSCTGGMTLNAAGAIAIAQLGTGRRPRPATTPSNSTGDQPEGGLVNTATITWKNGLGQTGMWDDAAGVS